MRQAKNVLEELRHPVRARRGRISAVFDGCGAKRAAVFTDGALDTKTNELIALAIAVAQQCDGDTASHARDAAGRRATASEVPEARGDAILMNGGPGPVHARRAYAAAEFATKP